MLIRSVALVATAGVAALLPGWPAKQAAADWTSTVQVVPSPAAPGSAEPQLTVSDKGVLLSWIERTGTYAALKFAERTSTGWTTPRQVAAGSDWFINWADVPSVIRMADGSIYGHWLQKSGPATYAWRGSDRPAR